MQKLTDYIFNLSPKKLAIYLVLGPLVLFLFHTGISIAFRTISNPEINQFASLLLAILSLILGVFILLWLVWLRSAVYSVQETEIGLARRWFKIAYTFLWIFILFNLVATIIEIPLKNSSWSEYAYLIYTSREFINFGGILIAYPIVCHYAARATMVKRTNEPATFIGAIPFTLLFIFGTVLGIPFVHNYFSTKTSTKSEVVVIYGISLALFFLILIVGFIAAVTGLV
ncbi:hypothetical protein FEE95_08415 [Maribacter algarum]|uniref:Uncharacterized protein n=1 Tax=Maribacter algarum (ex Zhang et al. 2020) TaxID=2578118 RepID=A0A5S3PWQ9_9FLAO|nr:hypothetical protein [Maribacter algarum]TMM59435.1 hypothetical protein FEE95_08415 [Maribacter algarum]